MLSLTRLVARADTQTPTVQSTVAAISVPMAGVRFDLSGAPVVS